MAEEIEENFTLVKGYETIKNSKNNIILYVE